MGSERLPRKVLRPVAGTPLLAHLLARMHRVDGADDVIVATTRDRADDAIDAFCRVQRVACHRGPRADVASRLLDAARSHRLDALVRVCADSPLLDPALVECALARFRHVTDTLVTNVHPRTYPRGQSVEVLPTRLLADGLELMQDPADREHVTRVFYRHPERWPIENIRSAEDLSGVHMAVDTAEDLAVVEHMIESMEHASWVYHLPELLPLYHRARTARATRTVLTPAPAAS